MVDTYLFNVSDLLNSGPLSQATPRHPLTAVRPRRINSKIDQVLLKRYIIYERVNIIIGFIGVDERAKET